MTDPAASHQDRHTTAAKQRLLHLAGLSARTAESERAIRRAAQTRLRAVQRDLAKLRPRVEIDAQAAEQYQSLTLELGQLQMVLSRARQVLG